MTKRHVKRWLGLSTLAACLAFAPQIARADTSRPAGSTEMSRPEAASARDVSAPAAGNFGSLGYAEREAKQPQTADFKGGEGVAIYIGGSAVAVVLFIVLLVVLL